MKISRLWTHGWYCKPSLHPGRRRLIEDRPSQMGLMGLVMLRPLGWAVPISVLGLCRGGGFFLFAFLISTISGPPVPVASTSLGSSAPSGTGGPLSVASDPGAGKACSIIHGFRGDWFSFAIYLINSQISVMGLCINELSSSFQLMIDSLKISLSVVSSQSWETLCPNYNDYVCRYLVSYERHSGYRCVWGNPLSSNFW